jgi:hypothetical protein
MMASDCIHRLELNSFYCVCHNDVKRKSNNNGKERNDVNWNGDRRKNIHHKNDGHGINHFP